MPLLSLVPPPEGKSPADKVSPGETHDVSGVSRLYTFQSGEWVLEPNQSPSPLDVFMPITGDIIECQEVPARSLPDPFKCPRPSTSRSISRSEIHDLQSVSDKLKLCVKFCHLISLNPTDIKYVEFGSDVLRDYLLSIVREGGLEFEDDSMCLIAEHDNGDVYVVVRGSSSYSEIQSNLQAIAIPTSGDRMYINERFLKHALNGLESQIRIRLQRVKSLNNIYVTGYSTGGAVACIIASILASSFPHASICCVTFGSPIAGDENFSKWLRQRVVNYHRVILDTDMMPLIPASIPFSQCGEALCVRYNQNERPLLEIWPEISDSRWAVSVRDVARSNRQKSLASVDVYCQQVCEALGNL